MASSKSAVVRAHQRAHTHVAVAPNTIHHHVKTFREHVKNLHYFAPEYEMSAVVTPAADIYAFGVCALEVSYLCLILHK
jgi:hypothetical protein